VTANGSVPVVSDLKISSQDEQDKNATMLDQITDMLQMLTSD